MLFLLDLPSPPPEPHPSPNDEPQRSASIQVPQPSAPEFPSDVPSEAPVPAPPIDWYREAEAVAEATIRQGAQPGPRRFGQQPATPYQKCKRRESPEWTPEPKRAGFAGGLPYVRVGERCIVGLGFLGCALGKLPEANGQLLAGMNDPDRPSSSVPDIEDCVP